MFAVFINDRGNLTEGGETGFNRNGEYAYLQKIGHEWSPIERYENHPIIKEHGLEPKHIVSGRIVDCQLKPNGKKLPESLMGMNLLGEIVHHIVI